MPAFSSSNGIPYSTGKMSDCYIPISGHLVHNKPRYW